MISKKHRFLFVHIPKNAGTSISAALQGHFRNLNPLEKLANRISKRVSGEKIIKPVERLKDHASALEYIEHLGDQYWKMYSFTFVRNPFDRLVSLFHYIQQNPAHQLHNQVQELNFTEFVSLARTTPRLTRSQTSFFTDSDGNCLVKKVGRVENVEADFGDVCRNLHEDIELGHTNQSKRKDFSVYYDAELTESVVNLFQQDFDLLGYSTELNSTETSPMQMEMHPRLVG